jgi:hypothetical protein
VGFQTLRLKTADCRRPERLTFAAQNHLPSGSSEILIVSSCKPLRSGFLCATRLLFNKVEADTELGLMIASNWSLPDYRFDAVINRTRPSVRVFVYVSRRSCAAQSSLAVVRPTDRHPHGPRPAACCRGRATSERARGAWSRGQCSPRDRAGRRPSAGGGPQHLINAPVYRDSPRSRLRATDSETV